MVTVVWVVFQVTTRAAPGIRGNSVLALARATVPGTVPDAKPERISEKCKGSIVAPAEPLLALPQHAACELDSKKTFQWHVLLRPFPSILVPSGLSSYFESSDLGKMVPPDLT
jgi:hypothetical protein